MEFQLSRECSCAHLAQQSLALALFQFGQVNRTQPDLYRTNSFPLLNPSQALGCETYPHPHWYKLPWSGVAVGPPKSINEIRQKETELGSRCPQEPRLGPGLLRCLFQYPSPTGEPGHPKIAQV
jgi:hypothetical protein